MRLYYVRHGLTDWNIAGRLQGHRDIPLNQTGRAQAARCGEILRDLLARGAGPVSHFDYVSSPLARARETMEIVRATLGLAPTGYGIEPRLTEISFGEWEGLTYAEVMVQDPDIVAKREADKWEFRPPGGENYRQLALRVGGLNPKQWARLRIEQASEGYARLVRAGLKLQHCEVAPGKQAVVSPVFALV